VNGTALARFIERRSLVASMVCGFAAFPHTIHEDVCADLSVAFKECVRPQERLRAISVHARLIGLRSRPTRRAPARFALRAIANALSARKRMQIRVRTAHRPHQEF
jgi:hypothetical protein